MSDELRPALTPEEWEQLETGAMSGLATDDIYTASPADRVGDIALLNASLPADSPYKITRADVDAVRDAANLWREELGATDRASELDHIVAKLASLLPPETP